jgi:2-oxoisovalerate dehydrogenase E1 component
VHAKLPVLYLVEDNGYAISAPVEAQTPGGDISRLVESFPDLASTAATAPTTRELRDAGDAIAYVRARRGPALVHAHVTRPYSHSQTDDETLVQDAEEREAEARARSAAQDEPLLVAEGLATQEELADMLTSVEREVNARRPGPRGAETRPAYRHVFVFSPDIDPTVGLFTRTAAGATPTRWSLDQRTLKDEMARDPRIVVFGQDVADASRTAALPNVQGKGGVFKVTFGLQRAFGSDRVFNSPLAEANIIGRGVGMALRG